MVESRCYHGRVICSECIVADDAAKRAFDIVRGLTIWNTYETRMGSPYVAIRLSDGGSDQVLYDTKRDAVRHQIHEMQCVYFSFRQSPNGFGSYRDAAIFLAWHRLAYDRGMRLPDPDDPSGGPDLVMPSANEHLQNQLNRLVN